MSVRAEISRTIHMSFVDVKQCSPLGAVRRVIALCCVRVCSHAISFWYTYVICMCIKLGLHVNTII